MKYVRSTPLARMQSNNIMQRTQGEMPRIMQLGLVLSIFLPLSFVCYFSLVVGRDGLRGTAKSNGATSNLRTTYNEYNEYAGVV
jgi:hypothetical protein